MWAQKHHSAMRHVGPTRVELGTRTIFNIMGPLSNPAGVKRQLLGVFAEQWLEPIAQVLKNLGTEHAWVVHGGDGLDEITTTTVTHVCELKNGNIRRFEISPADYGIRIATAAELQGADPAAQCPGDPRAVRRRGRPLSRHRAAECRRLRWWSRARRRT